MYPEDNQNQQSEDLRVEPSTSSQTSEEHQKSVSKKSLIREYSEAIIIAIILGIYDPCVCRSSF